MRARRRARPLAGIALTGVALLLAIGCSTVLGLGDYGIDHDAGSANGDTGIDDDARVEEAGCDVDLTVQCYPCAAETNQQLLNACVEGNCVQFDQARVKEQLEADGGLPPLPTNPPVPDAGPADAADGGG